MRPSSRLKAAPFLRLKIALPPHVALVSHSSLGRSSVQTLGTREPRSTEELKSLLLSLRFTACLSSSPECLVSHLSPQVTESPPQIGPNDWRIILMHCLVLAMVGLKLGAVIVNKNLVGSTLPSSIEWHNPLPDPCIPHQHTNMTYPSLVDSHFIIHNRILALSWSHPWRGNEFLGVSLTNCMG